MDTEDNVVLSGECLTDPQHCFHSTPGGGEEEEIIGVGSGTHEDTSDVASQSGLPQLLQEIIQVQIPGKN